MLMQTIEIKRTVPTAGKYDVVVCGGGCAGLTAAISAARCKMKVALIERYGFFGGTATAGYVVPMSGFFFEGKRVVGGIAWELVSRLERLGAALVEYPKGHVSYDPEYYKLIAEEMLTEAGVDLYTNSYISDCVTEGNRLTSVIIESKNGSEAISADCFIDATGDGDVFRLSGCEFLPEKKSEVQPLSLCFVLTGVDVTTPLLRDCIHHNGFEGKNSKNTEIAAFLSSLYNEGKAPKFGGPWFNTLLCGDALSVNVTRAEADATDRASYSEAERQLRRDMFKIVSLLRERYPEFKSCKIVSSGINAGIRESRRIKGLYTVSAEDFQSGKVFECPVAHAAHPMDIHSSKDEKQVLIYLKRDAFVPYETMIGDRITNLIAAGRCISAEDGPYASLRVQATLMSIGECAGIAASLCAANGVSVSDLPRDLLCRMIKERGVVL